MKKHRTAALGLWFCALRLFNYAFRQVLKITFAVFLAFS